MKEIEEYKKICKDLKKTIKPYERKLAKIREEIEFKKSEEYKELFLSLKKDGVIKSDYRNIDFDDFRKNWSKLYIEREGVKIDLLHHNGPFNIDNNYILIRYFIEEENYLIATHTEVIIKKVKNTCEIYDFKNRNNKRDFLIKIYNLIKKDFKLKNNDNQNELIELIK